MNSLKAIAQAIGESLLFSMLDKILSCVCSWSSAFEASRHIEVLESGGAIAQETRGFDVDRLETFTLRSKEGAADYRYMPDSNLPKLWITRVCRKAAVKNSILISYKDSIETVRLTMPETPDQIKRRLLDIGLSENQVVVLLNAEFISDGLTEQNLNQGVIELFDRVSVGRDPQTVANWYIAFFRDLCRLRLHETNRITNELLGQLSFRNLAFNRNPLQVEQLGGIIDLLRDKSITSMPLSTRPSSLR